VAGDGQRAGAWARRGGRAGRRQGEWVKALVHSTHICRRCDATAYMHALLAVAILLAEAVVPALLAYSFYSAL
jgi:hypothetical protein